MTRFRTRPAEVDAVCFTGSNWDEISAFIAPENGFPQAGVAVQFDTSSHGLLVALPEGRTRCSAGDWLIRDEEGNLLPYRPADFEKTYEPVDVLEDA